jgi:dTDP-glucose 4,6-dehydratase
MGSLLLSVSHTARALEEILVTGGLGFIGSNFIRHVLGSKKKVELVNVDYMGPASNPANLDSLIGNPRYRFVKGNIANSGLCRKLVRNADVVINFAAESHVDRSIAGPDPFLQSNVTGTFTLLDACRKANVKKVVHISTDEVYGSIDSGSFDDESPLNPSSPYSATKAAADMIAKAWYATYRIPVVILRCTNNFGPYQHPEKFIPKSIIRAIRNMPVPLYGGGRQIRDWIYVGDFCNAIEHAIDMGVPGEIYNISAGNEVTNREVAETVLKQLGKSPSMLVETQDRPGHDFRYSLSSGKARRKLHWKPVKTMRGALALTVNWYLANRKWWSSLASSKVLSSQPWKEKW